MAAHEELAGLGAALAEAQRRRSEVVKAGFAELAEVQRHLGEAFAPAAIALNAVHQQVAHVMANTARSVLAALDADHRNTD
ncbi:MAG TPA: hypothetical protein VIS06_04105 [Mycobacteriales bacterium]